MSHWFHHPISKFECSGRHGPRWVIVGCIGLFISASALFAELDIESIHAAYGDDYEVLKQVPGRPWVDEQHRYERDGLLINCNFVAGRCLWIDYWSGDRKLDDTFIFSELQRLFPRQIWRPMDQSGAQRRWLNEDDDRLTIRSKGFTLHMNEYIRNVLSRRAQWEF